MKKEQKLRADRQKTDFYKWKDLNKILEARIFKVFYYNTLGNKLDHKKYFSPNLYFLIRNTVHAHYKIHGTFRKV